jgi:hypothetical protein
MKSALIGGLFHAQCSRERPAHQGTHLVPKRTLSFVALTKVNQGLKPNKGRHAFGTAQAVP